MPSGEAGEKYPEARVPLKKLLAENHTCQKSWGLKLLIFCLRPFLGSQLLGFDQLSAPADAAIIFVCNHGEIWGPITTQGLPFNFRPWVNTEIAQPKSPDFIYKNTVSKQRWLPARLQWPCAKLLAKFLKQLMRAAGAIPLYSGNPGAMVRTFRETLQAMEAGQPILIFPENTVDEHGVTQLYLREGVSPLSSGFIHLAKLYYRESGKLTLFIPLYANKKQRTIRCGQGILYRPDSQRSQEQDLARELHQAMLDLYKASLHA